MKRISEIFVLLLFFFHFTAFSQGESKKLSLKGYRLKDEKF